MANARLTMRNVRSSKKTMAGPVSQAVVRQMIKSTLASSVELKRYVIAFTGGGTTTAGSVSPVTQGIINGDAYNSRDGDQLIVKHLTIRVDLAQTAGAVLSNTTRVVIFWDNQANGAVPTPSTILNTASYITGLNPIQMQSNRFHILSDEFITVSTNGEYERTRVWNFKLNHRVTFTDTTDVAAANGKGAMFVLFISNGGAGVYAGSFEVLFTDS